MLITISTDDERIAQIDVESNEQIENVKALIEVELQIPMTQQILVFHGNQLENVATLSSVGIKEHDLIHVSRLPINTNTQASSNSSTSIGIPPAAPLTTAREGMQLHEIPSNCSPELLLDIMEKNPNLVNQLEHHNPSLAKAVQSKSVQEIRLALMMQQMQVASKRFEEQEEARKLNNDPFNIEAQAKIEENIRLGNVQQNMEIAMEEMPEAFGRVHMLYIPCEVNGHPVKAFVDSGAQSTIMSSNCAERCGIMRLVDRRFAGQAIGVGTAKIIGRVHMASLKIGSIFYNCSFTILDQQDVDFLFGLDMLKRHQCCIDLKANHLVLESNTGPHNVSFLPEHEIPTSAKMNPDASSTTSTSMNPNTGAASSSAIDPAKIQQLVTMGFNEQMAREALKSCNGNIEAAAGILFASLDS